MSTIGERIERIRRIHPHGPNQYGQLYKSKVAAQLRFSKVTLYTLFQSDGGAGGEETFLIRDHMFESKKQPRSPEEWSTWFANNLTQIHRASVLPGMAVRTGKAWSVLKIIGWSGDVSSSTSLTGKSRGKRRTPRTRGSKSVASNRRVRNGKARTSKRKVARRKR